VATVGANLAHGRGHGPIGALVSAWPALALAGSFELLMTLIRTGKAVKVKRKLAVSLASGFRNGRAGSRLPSARRRPHREPGPRP